MILLKMLLPFVFQLMNELKFLLADSADEDLSEAERQRYQKVNS